MTIARNAENCDARSELASELVLSLFPGLDLLGHGFALEGFCVVAGPDSIWGRSIEDFHVPAGRFTGVIGGSPCQDFSRGNPKRGGGEGLRLLKEFARVVTEAQPEYFLLENVPTVPDIAEVVPMLGYAIQRFDLNANECGLKQDRLRHFQFGSKAGWILAPARHAAAGHEATCTASEAQRGSARRPWERFCELQGLPSTFALPGWSQRQAYRAVGNAVPLPVARCLARAVTIAISGLTPAPLALFDDRAAIAESRSGNLRTVTLPGFCRCGCGRPVTGKQKHATEACRKRCERRRKGYVRPMTIARAPGPVTVDLLADSGDANFSLEG